MPEIFVCAWLFSSVAGCGGAGVSDSDDSDADSILNGDEGRSDSVNTDGDQWPDWLDLDSDADGVSDADEAGDTDPKTKPVDQDGDGREDFRDGDYPRVGGGPGDGGASGGTDSGNTSGVQPDDGDDDDRDGLSNGTDRDDDGDGIDDQQESLGSPKLDSDGDGVPNRRDDDSDGDGVPDRIEGMKDSDDDGVADFLDGDSDGDGRADGDEDANGDGKVGGCSGSKCESNRTVVDTDGDGINDLVESVAGSNPNDKSSSIPAGDFYFVLPYEDPEQQGTLAFSTTLQQADVFFSVDTTGSFGEEIAAIQLSIDTLIVPGVKGVIPKPAFGVGRFEDFPLDPFGLPSDRPFELLQSITTDGDKIRAGVNALPPAAGGLDIPEAGLEALYQWSTGFGIPELGLPPIGASGIGGAGFRRDSLPIIIQITDAVSHLPGDYAAFGIKTRSQAQTVAALNAVGARVIGVRSTENAGKFGDPRQELIELASATGATIPTAADGKCATGIDGAKVESTNNVCPLVFDVRPDGTGLGQIIVDAVGQLAALSTLDISSVPIGKQQGERAEPLPAGKTTASFIVAITPEPPVPAGATIDGEVFRDVTPGSTVNFRLHARNSFLKHQQDVQLFTVDIHVLGDAVTVLDERKVYIVIPRRLPDIEIPIQ